MQRRLLYPSNHLSETATKRSVKTVGGLNTPETEAIAYFIPPTHRIIARYDPRKAPGNMTRKCLPGRNASEIYDHFPRTKPKDTTKVPKTRRICVASINSERSRTVSQSQFQRPWFQPQNPVAYPLSNLRGLGLHCRGFSFFKRYQQNAEKDP